MKRHAVLSALAAVAAGSALPRSVHAADAVKLRVLRANVESTMGPQYALERGIFAKYGLDVTVELSSSGAAATAAVLGGAAQIASSNVLSLVIAHAKGIPIGLIAPGAAYVPGPPTVGVMVARNAAFHSAADLTGHTVAVEGLHDLGTLSVMAWAQKSGVDPKSFKFVEMPDSVKAAAVARGAVDAAEIFTPFFEPALETLRMLTMPYAAIADTFLINGWFAHNDWLAANRDVAARFGRALIEAQAWANRDRAESAKILAAFTKIDPATIARMNRVTFGSRLDPSLVAPIVTIAAQFDLIPAAFPAAQLLTPAT